MPDTMTAPFFFTRFNVLATGAWLLAFALQPVHGALPPEAASLIQAAGNADDDHEREAVLEKLAAVPGLEPGLSEEAKALAAFVHRWNGRSLKFYASQYRGIKSYDAILNYDFKVAKDSPLFPLTSIYQGRIIAWNLIENSTVRSSPKFAPQFKDAAVKSFQLMADTFPGNHIAGMYLGRSIPWPREYSHVEGAPAWAELQREQLDRLREIIYWWIDHRQAPDGQFGGGWDDDCEMWRWWAPVLLGFDDPKIRDSQVKFSRAALRRPAFKTGYTQEIGDVEHTAEDTTDNLVPMLVLQPEEPRWRDWALKLGDLMQTVWTGRNEQGGLQFKSYYFTDHEVSTEGRRQFDVIADVGALHPALLAWQRTGDKKLGATMTAWLDTWVDATARAENGKPAGILPASIRWPDGQAAGAAGNWWEPVKAGGYMHSYYIWPSVITEMTDALVVAYLQTGNERYLAPIRSMANIRLHYLKHPSEDASKPGSEAWCAAQLAPRKSANSNVGGLIKTIGRLKALTGTREFDELLAMEGGEFVIRTDAAGRRDLEAALRESAEALRVNFPGFTSEIRSTDRVMRFGQFLSQDYQFDAYKGVTIPKFELLYRMVTGDKNAPRFPQLAVRWLTPPQDMAALVTESRTTQFEAELFSFGDSARSITAEFHLLVPGTYQAQLLSEGQPVGAPLQPLKVEAGHLARLKFDLPQHRLCVLKIGPAAG